MNLFTKAYINQIDKNKKWSEAVSMATMLHGSFRNTKVFLPEEHSEQLIIF